MKINNQYLTCSISHEHRTSFLKRKILSDIGNYLYKRNYLSTWTLRKSVTSIRECQHLSELLTTYMRECISSAYDRGVFVVCSRMIADPYIQGDSVDAIIQTLQAKERQYFDALLWYRKGDFEYELNKLRLDEAAIKNISPLILRHVRVAFTIGIKQAVERITNPAPVLF